MVATLFQHCYAVLRKNSSLRIVTCNISGASGFITGTKEIRTKLDICFPYGSGGVTTWLKPVTLSWLTNYFVGIAGQQTERRYARNIAFCEGDATSTRALYLCAQNYTVYQRLTCIKIHCNYKTKLRSRMVFFWRRRNERANLTRHCQFEYQNRGRINKIYLRELCFYFLLLTKHFSLCFPCT